MDSRKIAEQYRLKHWAQIIHERNNSGLNVKQFCKQNNIRENVYYYWLNRLREAVCTVIVDINTPISKNLAKNVVKANDKNSFPTCSDNQNIVPKGFTQLIADELKENESSLIIKISECQISVTNKTDLTLLRKVCTTLGSL